MERVKDKQKWPLIVLSPHPQNNIAFPLFPYFKHSIIFQILSPVMHQSKQVLVFSFLLLFPCFFFLNFHGRYAVVASPDQMAATDSADANTDDNIQLVQILFIFV